MKFSRQKVKRVRPLLGTYVTIELDAAAPEDTLNAWITAGFAAIETIDHLMSRYRPDSDLSRLNQAQAGVGVTIHPHTANVLKAANNLYSLSDGAFDIRCQAVPAGGRAPLEIRGERARKNGPWTFDLGGIAKGYAVDCAVTRIKRMASRSRISGIVNAGGDLRIWGDRFIMVAAQIEGEAPWVRPLELRSTSAATSSVRLSRGSAHSRLAPAQHLRMPTGVPLRQAKTVTVFADRCLWADALTKVVLAGPADAASRCLSSHRARALIFRPSGALEGILQ